MLRCGRPIVAWTTRGRLALCKREGEGEGYLLINRWLRSVTPHLNPLPSARGEATEGVADSTGKPNRQRYAEHNLPLVSV
jgi:hypothetical protein